MLCYLEGGRWGVHVEDEGVQLIADALVGLCPGEKGGSEVVEIQVPILGVPGVGWRAVANFLSEAGCIQIAYTERRCLNC